MGALYQGKFIYKQANRLSVPAGPIKKSTCQSRKTRFILKYKFFWTHKKNASFERFQMGKIDPMHQKGGRCTSRGSKEYSRDGHGVSEF